MQRQHTQIPQLTDTTALLYEVWWNTFKNVWICDKTDLKVSGIYKVQ